MSSVLADTHTILWYLFEPSQLSQAADAALSGAVQTGDKVFVSAISVIEVRYLVEKTKVPPTTCDDLMAAIDDPAIPVELLPIDLNVARAVEQIPRASVPDLPDRIIAATAKLYNLPLVTRDQKLQTAPIITIW